MSPPLRAEHLEMPQGEGASGLLVKVGATILGPCLILVLACGGGELGQDAGNVGGAEVTRLNSTACTGCRLDLAFLGSLGLETDSILLQHNSRPTQLPDGRFVVAPTSEAGVVAVFDSLGAPAVPVGRWGEGPGENSYIIGAYAWSATDVFLMEAWRIGWFHADSGQFTIVPVAKSWQTADVATLPTLGRIVANAYEGTSRLLVVFDTTGTMQAEMGPERPPFRSDLYRKLMAVAAARDGRSFWSGAVQYRVQLQHWDIEGSLLQVIDSAPPWYTPFDSTALQAAFQGGDLAMRPLPFLRALRDARDGPLWALYNIAADGWQATEEPPDDPREVDLEYHPSSYDGVLQAFDRESGAPGLGFRTSVPFNGFIDDSTLYTLRDNPAGYWFIDVYRFRVVGQSSRDSE